MSDESRVPWWCGARGEWYVVVQTVLFVVVFFGPRTLPGLPVWPVSLARFWGFGGAALASAGGVLLLASLIRLCSNLTPLPAPKPQSILVRTGPYRLVRHPIYAGGIAVAYGWGLHVQGWLTLVSATVLLIFFDIKSRREERWLVEKFPDYPEYQKHVKKLIPFIY